MKKNHQMGAVVASAICVALTGCSSTAPDDPSTTGVDQIGITRVEQAADGSERVTYQILTGEAARRLDAHRQALEAAVASHRDDSEIVI